MRYIHPVVLLKIKLVGALLCNSVFVLTGPADMGLSLGYHVKHNYDLPAMLASSDMEPVYTTVVEVRDLTCTASLLKHGRVALYDAAA